MDWYYGEQPIGLLGAVALYYRFALRFHSYSGYEDIVYMVREYLRQRQNEIQIFWNNRKMISISH